MKSDGSIESITITTPDGTTGPISMENFKKGVKRVRRMLREVPLNNDKLDDKPPPAPDPGVERKLITGGDPDALFLDIPLKDDFEKENCEYFECGKDDELAEMKEVGDALRREKATWLENVAMGYLWKRAGGTHGGQAVLGRAVVTTARERIFTPYMGLVILSADHVREFKFDRYQVEALIYHELLHFRYDEGNLFTVGHDWEAFKLEVEEYGMWKPNLRIAAAAFKQLNLL